MIRRPLVSTRNDTLFTDTTNFRSAGRKLPSGYYDRIVDCAEELVLFAVLTRGHADQLVGRYSERKDREEPVATPAQLAELPGASTLSERRHCRPVLMQPSEDRKSVV